MSSTWTPFRCLTGVLLLAEAAPALLGAQIRTPIATSVAIAPGPAPTNFRVASMTATSVSLAWDAMAGARSYLVTRIKTSDPACCQAMSGALASPGWQDGSLQPQTEYTYAVSVSYTNGSTGSTEIATMTPALPLNFTLSAELLSRTEARLSASACNPTTTGGRGPTAVLPSGSTPTGASLKWGKVSGAANYVVHRAPEGTTNWTLIGSTCGGASAIQAFGDSLGVADRTGRIGGGGQVYRVMAIGSRGETGWNTFHFTPPMAAPPPLTATVSGSTVTLKWVASPVTWVQNGNAPPAYSPGNYIVTSSFGYTKTRSMASSPQDVIYGVPLGTHTFSIRGEWYPDGKTASRSTQVTVAY